MAQENLPEGAPTGIYCGLYRVRITHPSKEIAARYNERSELGIEVCLDYDIYHPLKYKLTSNISDCAPLRIGDLADVKVALEGKRALITGAARGIGKALADKLAANGARVAYADVDVDGVKSAAEQTPGAIWLDMDVASGDAVVAAVSAVAEQFGGIDILVNNAGVNTAKHRVNIDQFPREEWDRIVGIDLTGTYLVTQAVARVMISQGTGRIVNISSVMGVVPARLQCAFTAAKAGVIQLTRSSAIELAPHGILVNCVAPGSTMTEGTKGLFYGENAAQRERAERLLSHIPLGRPGTVEDMAHAVLFFVAPESSYITGQVLSVDGGWTAGGFFRDF